MVRNQALNERFVQLRVGAAERHLPPAVHLVAKQSSLSGSGPMANAVQVTDMLYYRQCLGHFCLVFLMSYHSGSFVSEDYGLKVTNSRPSPEEMEHFFF